MKITKKQFSTLQSYYECKLDVESIKKALANLEYYANFQIGKKKLLEEINKAHKILNQIEFEK